MQRGMIGTRLRIPRAVGDPRLSVQRRLAAQRTFSNSVILSEARERESKDLPSRQKRFWGQTPRLTGALGCRQPEGPSVATRSLRIFEKCVRLVGELQTGRVIGFPQLGPFRDTLPAPMNVWIKTVLGLVAVWAAGYGIIYSLHASKPTAESVSAFLARTDVAQEQGRERARTIAKVEDQLNDVTFDDRQKLQRSGEPEAFLPLPDHPGAGSVSGRHAARRFQADHGRFQQDGP